MKLEQKHDELHGIIRAIWCVDSDTGEECLVDLYEHKVIAKRVNGKIIDPGEQNETVTEEKK